MPRGPDYLGKSRGRQDGPNYLDRDTGVNWKKHERDVEKRSGGRRRAASGAAPGKPADTKDQHYLRECKATRGAGMSLSGKWISKITGEALSLGKVPLIELRFDGQVEPTPTDWVMIPAIDFEELLDELRSTQ